MITENYRKLNEQLHATNEGYGTSGQKYASQVMQLAANLRTQDILDYGCGKSTLSNNLPFIIKQYDPAIPKYSDNPMPAELVVCTDVLEHIEPEMLGEVLDDLKRVTRKKGYFIIATRPAKKILADGRNAHLIVENSRWWLNALWDKFKITGFNDMGGEILVLVEPL